MVEDCDAIEATTREDRIRAKLTCKVSAKRQALNLIAEIQRFGRVSDLGLRRFRDMRDRLAPVVPPVASLCRRMMASDHQVQALRRLVHARAWAVNDDYRLLRRVVEVERRLRESLFFYPAPPADFDVPELIEILLLTEALVDQQRAAFEDFAQEK